MSTIDDKAHEWCKQHPLLSIAVVSLHLCFEAMLELMFMLSNWFATDKISPKQSVIVFYLTRGTMMALRETNWPIEFFTEVVQCIIKDSCD